MCNYVGKLVFNDHFGSSIDPCYIQNLMRNYVVKRYILYEKTWFFHICENKGADQLHGNHAADQLLSSRYIVQYLCFLNSKFQTSSHLLWLYSWVCVRPGRKFLRQVLSCHGSYLSLSWVPKFSDTPLTLFVNL